MVKLDIPIENNKEFMDQIERIIVERVRHLLYDDKNLKEVLAKAINQYFSWNDSSIEKFTKKTVIELIGSAVGDGSTLPPDKKAENVIIRLLREAISSFVTEKLKDVKISGME